MVSGRRKTGQDTRARVQERLAWAEIELAYDLGLIDTQLPFPEARRRFRIDDDARGLAGRQDFSKRLRYFSTS